MDKRHNSNQSITPAEHQFDQYLKILKEEIENVNFHGKRRDRLVKEVDVIFEHRPYLRKVL